MATPCNFVVLCCTRACAAEIIFPPHSFVDFVFEDITLYNVGSVLWRLFSILEVVQYIGGITSVLWEDSFSTVGGKLQYCGGCSVQWGDSFSTVGDSFSTVEVIQYSGGITSVLWGCIQYCGGIPSVLWGITAVHVGDTFSTVEVVQYSGG